VAIGFLRTHQRRVLVPLAIVIIPCFIFLYGASSFFGQRRGGAYAEVNGRSISMEEMVSMRRGMAHLTFRPASDGEIIRWIISSDAAREFGLAAGTSEVRDYMQARMKRHLGDKFTQQDYIDHLLEMNFSESQLMGLAEENLIQVKVDRVLDASATVTSEELYLHYCWNKDMLTIRHADFAASDYRERAGEPDEAAVAKYYADGVKKGYEGAPQLFQAPTAEISYLFASYEDFESKVDATDEKLKAHYEQTKHRYHAPEEPKEPKAPEDPEAADAEAPAPAPAEAEGAEAGASAAPAAPAAPEEPGEPEAPAEGEAAEAGPAEEEPDDHLPHKPFEEVRAEVDKDYREITSKRNAHEALEELATKLNSADDPVSDADALKLAKEKGLILAKAGPLTYDDLKEFEPFGNASGLGAVLFFDIKAPVKDPAWSDAEVTQKGAVSFKLLDRKEAVKLELAACREKVVEKIIDKLAADAAYAAAKEARRAIINGSFDQAQMKESGPFEAGDSVVREFRDKPVDEVSQVYDAPPPPPPVRDEDDEDGADDVANAGPVYRVAILSDRASPSRQAFADDEEWGLGYMPRYTRSLFILSGWRQQTWSDARPQLHDDSRRRGGGGGGGGGGGDEGGGSSE